MSDLEARILECLRKKPMSISEISREIDEKKYAVSKKIEVMAEDGRIETHKIGRSTACIINEDHADTDGRIQEEQRPDSVIQDQNEQETTRTDTQDPSKYSHRGEETGDAPQVEYRSSNPRTIGIVSGKGGVGKTVVTLNLGKAMQDLGEDVIVVDSDAEMSNLGLHLGLHTYPVSLKQVIEEDVHVMSAMHIHKESGLRVLPTSLAAESTELDLDRAFQKIPDNYTVLVDSPPGFERPLNRVIETCDELVFVTTPEIPAVTDTYKLCNAAKERGTDVLGVVVNMHSPSNDHLSTAEVEQAVEERVIGTIEKKNSVPESIFSETPVVDRKPHSTVSRSFKEIAAEISGKEYRVSLLDRIKGLLQ